MLQMLQELELAVRALSQDWSAEGLHNLLDSHRLSRQLILGRTAVTSQYQVLV